MHVASPCTLAVDDPDELIRPAVAGTVSVLSGIFRHAPSVRRVVITASCASVITKQDTFRVFDAQTDWNDRAVEEVRAKGRAADPIDMYRASKTLAERAAWAFVEEHRGGGGVRCGDGAPAVGVWAVGGGWVVGGATFVDEDVVGCGDRENGERVSCCKWVSAVVLVRYGFRLRIDERVVSSGEWVDVRDVALAHVLAIQTEAAAGRRIIVSAGPYKFQEWGEFAYSTPVLLSGSLKRVS